MMRPLAPRDDEIIELPPPGSPLLPRTPFRFIAHYVGSGFFGPIVGMTLLIAAAAAIETIYPYFFGKLVSALSGEIESPTPAAWFAGLVGAWFFGYTMNHAYAAYSTARLADLRKRMHETLFGYLHGHAPRYFLDHASGGLTQKVRQAAQAAIVLIDYICVNIVRMSVMFGVTLLVVYHQAPQLLAPFGVFVVLFMMTAAAGAQRIRKYAKTAAEAQSEIVARMVDSVSNWDVVRSFARAAFESVSLKPYNDAERDAQVRLRFAAVVMRLVLHVFSISFLAWLVWQALVATRAGEMSVGTFTTILTLSTLVGTHIRALGDQLFVYFEYYGILAESLSVVLAPHEIVDVPGAKPLNVTGGAIDIEDLGFSYADGTPVFTGFSLSIKAGERVGLVGPSGAGKSTLIKLLRRQFTFEGGRIVIDGQDIAHVTWDSLHDRIAEVPQNPSIFHRSVRDNIRYSRPDAGDDEVIAAAKLAHCHEFIASRPEAYDSMVGEKGLKLSGGERQRVAIARAFLKNAPILILDEATSSLDSEAEHLIQDGLLALMKGRTVIAIAHRLSTIAHLDRIVVLDRGRIAEQGTHRELLEAGGTYAKLWQRQAGGFI
jgi:ATP-binding cassette subfamily B protein